MPTRVVVLSLRDPQRFGAADMTRYLPHAVVATTFVIVLPAVGVWMLVPSGGPASSILSVLVAMVVSVAAASAASALWARRPGSRDVVFADLMLWGWLRRLRAERRLGRARKVLGAGAIGSEPRRGGIQRRVAALKRLSAMLEAHDPDTHGHTRRVTRHAERIARAMHLSPAEVAKVRTAAALHDVGKLRTPPEILHKPGRLTEREFEVIKRHPVDGAEMLSGIGDSDVAAMVRHHHERLDGAGYPDGLAGEQIPLGARIIAVADTFDAMTSKRAYHGASNHQRALDVLSEEAGTRLDAAAVSAFLGYYSGRTSVAWSAVVTAAPQRFMGWLGSAYERLGTGAASIAQALPAAGAAALLVAPMPGGGPAVGVGSPEARQRDGAGQAEGARLAMASSGRVEATARTPRRSSRSVPAERPSRRGDRAPRTPERPRAPLAPARSPDGGSTPAASEPVLPNRGSGPGTDANVPPDVRLPDAPPPSVKEPTEVVPTVDLPPVRLPAAELPQVEVPHVEVPPVAVPDVDLPRLSLESLPTLPR